MGALNVALYKWCSIFSSFYNVVDLGGGSAKCC